MCAWVRMTGETAVVDDGKRSVVDGLRILAELPDGFARHHGDGERDVDAARGALHGDGQPRIRRLIDGSGTPADSRPNRRMSPSAKLKLV